MNYEEKYKQALERARDLHDNHPLGQPQTWMTCEKIFPELKESEDEKIRNEIIIYIGAKQDIDLETHNRWCAYLEKSTNEEVLRALRAEYEKGVADTVAKYEQKEQKPTEWSEDERIRKWILSYFEGWLNTDCPSELQEKVEHVTAWLEKQGEKEPIEQDTETRDLWEYIKEWRENFGRLPKDEDELASCIDYVMKRQKPADKIEQNPTWSEEDENFYKSVIKGLQTYNCNDTPCSNWLKSIKSRVMTQQEWSDKDEIFLFNITKDLEKLEKESKIEQLKYVYNEEISWLKSIKPNHWKPSEFQLECLKKVIPHNNTEKDGELEDVLTELYNDLKTLI